MMPEVVYQTDGQSTLNVYALNWLPDDTILFVLQTSGTCEYDDSSAVLMRIIPGGETEVIAEQVASSYTISPNNRYLVWVGFDKETSTSFLGLTDLHDGRTGKLLSIAVGESGVDTVYEG